MKEKLRGILQNLKNKAISCWTGVSSLSRRLWLKAVKRTRELWQSFRQSKFAECVRKYSFAAWNSRAVLWLRSKCGQLKTKFTSFRQGEKKPVQDITAAVENDGISTELIEKELRRERYLHRYRNLLRSTVYALIVTAAAAALIATLLLPVLQIYGSSMTPTLHEGDIVISVKTTSYEYGDICSFYYSNRILVKRVIGKPLDVVSMDEEGNVYVNGKFIDEPYIKEKALGECDIEFPYRVPEGSYFMIGDHRLTSIDSRSSSVGCISNDEIVGKIVMTVWPPKHMGFSK